MRDNLFRPAEQVGVVSSTRPRRRFAVLLAIVAGGALLLGLVAAAPAARGRGAKPKAPRSAPPAPRPHPPEPAIYRFAEMNALDMSRLDREKTVVLMPFGGIEPFGPHLPVGAGGLAAEWIAEATARRVRELKPEYSVALAPLVPYGTAPTVAYGSIHMHPTAIYMGSDDFRNLLYGTLLRYGEGGWRYVALLSYDISPEFNRRLNEAADYFLAGYGMRTINASGLVWSDSACYAGLTGLAVRLAMDTTVVRPPLDVHGGTAMTSMMLAMRPELVDPSYLTLPPIPLRTLTDIPVVAGRPGWLTYFGAPAQARPEYGRGVLEALAEAHAQLVVRLTAAGPPPAGPTPADLLKRSFAARDAVSSMNLFEYRRRRPYEAWLKSMTAPKPAPEAPH